MRPGQIRRLAILPLLVASLVIAGILLVRASAPGTAQDRQGFRISATPAAPFDGTLLGIRFGPTDVLVRDGSQRSLQGRCAAGKFDVEEGAKFLPPPPNYLPRGAIQSIPPGYLDVPNAPNPFALVCPSTGEVLRAALSYTIPSANGPPGELHILRVFDPEPDFSTTASADQIRTVTVGSRQAVLIDTSTPAGLGLPGMPSITLVFPQPDGYLAVTSLGIPAEEILNVAGSLAMEDLR